MTPSSARPERLNMSRVTRNGHCCRVVGHRGDEIWLQIGVTSPVTPKLSDPSCAMTKGAQPNAHRTATEVPRNLRCVRSIENACFWISHSMCMMRSASCQDLSPVTSRCLDSPCMPARRRCGVSAAVANVWRASWMYGFQGAVAPGCPDAEPSRHRRTGRAGVTLA
jgi:hypothetical protein